MQILKACTNPNYGWQYHPAVKMWRGFEPALECYYNSCILEWLKRGFKNTMLFCARTKYCTILHVTMDSLILPNWFGNSAFHDSHKSNLLRKDYDYYSRYNWNVPNDLPYVWLK